MKIHIYYNIQESAWGGGNQFFHALRKELRKLDYYAEDVETADVILFNSYQNLAKVIKLKQKYPNKKFVHRLGPIFYLHRGMKWKKIDRLVINVTNTLADMVVFQSKWSYEKTLELDFNVSGKEDLRLIGNTVNSNIFNRNNKSVFNKNKVKLIASSWSTNIKKGFKYYEYLDNNLDWNTYEMTFVGNSDVKFKNIKHIEALPSKELALLLKKHDIFVSAVEDDACSNSMIEALACGLPVVALKSGGNKEIVFKEENLFENEEDMLEKIDLLVDQYEERQNNISVLSINEITKEYIKACDDVGSKKCSKQELDILYREVKHTIKKVTKKNIIKRVVLKIIRIFT